MGRVSAGLDVINAALVGIWSWGYASISVNPGRGDISPNCFLAYCALAKQVPHLARYVLREW